MNNNQTRRELWLRRIRKALSRNQLGLFVNKSGCPNLKNKDLLYLIKKGLIVRKTYGKHGITYAYLAPADGIPLEGDVFCPECKRRVDLHYPFNHPDPYPNFKSQERFYHALDCGVRDDHNMDWKRNPLR